MTVYLSKSAVESASNEAVILVEGDRAFVVEREKDGGIIHPMATEKHMCYPICMAKDDGFLEAGDWVVIPYVKTSPPSHSLYGQDGTFQEIVWTE